MFKPYATVLKWLVAIPIVRLKFPFVILDHVISKCEDMIEHQNDILELASKWLEEGREVAFATVVATWGSSPRPCGSQLVVDDKGEFFGSVSGGCVEGAVISEAREVMQTMKPKLLEFSVSNEMAWDVGLACGGTVKIYVEPVVAEG